VFLCAFETIEKDSINHPSDLTSSPIFHWAESPPFASPLLLPASSAAEFNLSANGIFLGV
jgi:hypothetical protein